MSMKVVFLFLFAVVFSACASKKQNVENNADTKVESKLEEVKPLEIDPKLPAWLIEKIKLIAKDETILVGSQVIQLSDKKKKYYTLPVACCDQFLPLFDAEGKLLCHPEGGITGNGDGKCKGLEKKLKNSKVVWSK